MHRHGARWFRSCLPPKNSRLGENSFWPSSALAGAPDGFGLDDHWNDAKGASTFLLGLAGLGSTRGSCNPPWYVRGPSGIGKKVLIAPRGFPRHLIRPLKVWFILDFLQYPVY